MCSASSGSVLLGDGRQHVGRLARGGHVAAALALVHALVGEREHGRRARVLARHASTDPWAAVIEKPCPRSVIASAQRSGESLRLRGSPQAASTQNSSPPIR